MKGLFVVFHGFSAHSGITKKIYAQRDGLTHGGVATELCHTQITSSGEQLRVIDNQTVESYGWGAKAKITKRLCFGKVTRYVADNNIKLIYVRHDHNSSPVLIHWFRQLKRTGARIALEVPTYPYDAEFAQSKWSRKLKLQIDKLFRRAVMRHVDRIVTFSDHTQIFGRPTICISNGIDFSQIKVKSGRRDTPHELRLVGVANIHFWHGFDRVIEGMARYYASPRTRIVRFDIVGDGVQSTIDSYAEAIARHGLGNYIRILGPRSGEGLDEVFEWCDMGIASLARHRNDIDSIKTLKNREYAARGIPFAYSETDEDFDSMPYVMKIAANETPLEVEALLRFYDSQTLEPVQIRTSIEATLSWDEQMKKVIREMEKI